MLYRTLSIHEHGVLVLCLFLWRFYQSRVKDSSLLLHALLASSLIWLATMRLPYYITPFLLASFVFISCGQEDEEVLAPSQDRMVEASTQLPLGTWSIAQYKEQGSFFSFSSESMLHFTESQLLVLEEVTAFDINEGQRFDKIDTTAVYSIEQYTDGYLIDSYPATFSANRDSSLTLCCNGWQVFLCR